MGEVTDRSAAQDRELVLPSGLVVRADADGVMFVERGRDADFEQLEEPLTTDDVRALIPFLLPERAQVHRYEGSDVIDVLHTNGKVETVETLLARIRERGGRIDQIGSSHSNVARALAKDALALADTFEAIRAR